MATIMIDPGICGMVTTVKVESVDGQTCRISVESPCEAICALGEELKEVDGYGVAFRNFMENPVYIAAAKHYKHAACPVPSGIIKAIEVACDLALPKDVIFKFE